MREEGPPTPEPFDPKRLPSNPALPKGKKERDFILWMAPIARQVQVMTGIPASVCIAQASLESDWGSVPIPRDEKGPSHNYWGMKCSSYDRSTPFYVDWRKIRSPTHEYDPKTKKYYRKVDCFKGYNSPLEGAVDWAFRFYRFGFYFGDQKIRSALSARRNWEAFLDRGALHNYATGPNYLPSIKKLIRSFKLYLYDVPPEHWDLLPEIAKIAPVR